MHYLYMKMWLAGLQKRGGGGGGGGCGLLIGPIPPEIENTIGTNEAVLNFSHPLHTPASSLAHSTYIALHWTYYDKMGQVG